MSRRPRERLPNVLAWGFSCAGFLLLSLLTIQMLTGHLVRHVAILPMWIAYASIVAAASLLLSRARRRCARWHLAFANQLHLHGARTLSIEDASSWIRACWTPLAPSSEPPALLDEGPYARWAMMWVGRYNAMLAANPGSSAAYACVMLAARFPAHLMWTAAALHERDAVRAHGYEVTLVDAGLLVEAEEDVAHDLQNDPLAGARLCTVAIHAAKMATLLGCTPQVSRRT